MKFFLGEKLLLWVKAGVDFWYNLERDKQVVKKCTVVVWIKCVGIRSQDRHLKTNITVQSIYTLHFDKNTCICDKPTARGSNACIIKLFCSNRNLWTICRCRDSNTGPSTSLVDALQLRENQKVLRIENQNIIRKENQNVLRRENLNVVWRENIKVLRRETKK